MKTRNWVFVLVAILIITFSFLSFYPRPIGRVNVNLVNANSDLAGGKQAWEFKVNDKEISAGSSIKVWDRFEIKVIEFASQKTVDKLDIVSLIEEGDLIAYAYYGSASSQGESLYIHIQHNDGTFRGVSVNINNQ
ncbi:MAG: hypothetical protein WA126_12075 [Thermodesulfovibrionales bacterium]